jgi:hypothetical protein
MRIRYASLRAVIHVAHTSYYFAREYEGARRSDLIVVRTISGFGTHWRSALAEQAFDT